MLSSTASNATVHALLQVPGEAGSRSAEGVRPRTKGEVMSALGVLTRPAVRETDDVGLVTRVRAGDERAFELLFLRYQPRIAAYVRGMVGDHARAEDITQDIFISAL